MGATNGLVCDVALVCVCGQSGVARVGAVVCAGLLHGMLVRLQSPIWQVKHLVVFGWRSDTIKRARVCSCAKCRRSCQLPWPVDSLFFVTLCGRLAQTKQSCDTRTVRVSCGSPALSPCYATKGRVCCWRCWCVRVCVV